MNHHRSPVLAGLFAFAVLILSACAEQADPWHCYAQRPADIAQMAPYSDEDQGPFRFPLDDLTASQRQPSAPFQANGLETPTRREFHAAEDYLSPPGTPVHAIATGRVSYSGPMGGYGWLVIVDHPQANLHSLYGHLSPSRWQIDNGTPVEQGELLGYLGDPDENGGTAEQPLRPHLHLGLRAGQRSDYPARGEWRWQAGWITPCPTDLGWLQPSAILAAQTIPAGGFTQPGGRFLQIWAVELILAGLYVIAGLGIVIYGLRRDKPFTILVYGALMLVAGLFLSSRGFKFSPVLFVSAAITLAIGLVKLRGRLKNPARTEEHETPKAQG